MKLNKGLILLGIVAVLALIPVSSASTGTTPVHSVYVYSTLPGAQLNLSVNPGTTGILYPDLHFELISSTNDTNYTITLNGNLAAQGNFSGYRNISIQVPAAVDVATFQVLLDGQYYNYSNIAIQQTAIEYTHTKSPLLQFSLGDVITTLEKGLAGAAIIALGSAFTMFSIVSKKKRMEYSPVPLKGKPHIYERPDRGFNDFDSAEKVKEKLDEFNPSDEEVTKNDTIVSKNEGEEK